MHGSAEEVAANWQRGLANSVDKIKAGAQRVTKAPGQSAAEAKARWIASLSDSAVQDKWEAAVRSVSLAQWQDAIINKGANRVAQGASAAQEKFASSMVPLLRYIDQGVQQVNQMPSTTFEDRINRSNAFMRWMHDYRRPA